ncbi:aminotransferase class V-fold PLP-dependent enzyme [Clostridium sp. DJ247]|uniref:aminotransferase class V-fold PLP-dependent enzyme n=1 Tax=Clostridium sp. DJ247 TaxID=2726188 RepID=UPI0016278099|nr:aminotransferase class V-fold PLP-dependent enzyme [Clostridium sp. DJ247]MBC2582962.1 aminotransferase class V-fold PLP-dependent enzyme [Clostridium sp. DJ247]
MPIYLDNAATSYPKPDIVINKMSNFMKNIGATAGRGAYKNAIETNRLIFNCREAICNLFNGKDPSKVIFTYNITESLNLVINGLLQRGDHVITSSIEHNAVWRPLKTLERDQCIEISTAPCNNEGFTSIEAIESLIKPNTRLIVFTHASNVLGTIQPISDIGKIAKKHGITFLVDSAQTAGAYPIDVVRDNIDFLAFTGHKSLLGPTGTGGLLINCDSCISPLKSGGTGGDSKNPFQPDYLPNRFEAGTPNVVGIIGLREAVNFISSIGVGNIREREEILTNYALQELSQISDITIYGPKDSKKIVGVISFNIDNLTVDQISNELSKNDIMVRVGYHCAPSAHKLMGTLNTGAVRIGIGYFNKKKHIDALIKVLNALK